MLDIYKKDYIRYKKTKWDFKSIFQSLKSKQLRYVMFGRIGTGKGLFSVLSRIYAKHLGQKIGCEIEFRNVDEGLVLMHGYGITINPSAIVGKDMTIFKGATIGSIRSGKKMGTPIIGDRVTICCNAMVCGNIKVGNDVLISANSFCNFDVPDNSIVLGNPGTIHKKINASDDYQ